MYKSGLVSAAIVGAMVVMAAPAAAQPTPKFEYGKAAEVEAVKAVEWTASAEAGIVFTTGNSETTTATGGVHATRKTGQNKLSLDGTLTYAKSGIRVFDAESDRNGNGILESEDEIRTVSTETAEAMMARLRYDRFLTKHNSLFAAAIGARDVPAGKEGVYGAQLGYARQLYKTDTAETTAELGYDFSRENLIVGDTLNIHSARAFIGHKDELTTGTSLIASVEALTNLNSLTLPTGRDGGAGKDTRVNGLVAVSAKLGKSLSIQTSVELRYDHRPGPLKIDTAMVAPGFVPEATHLDATMKASLIYTFLQ